MIRAIPTEYRGVQMRSKLEAKCAASLDRLRIQWVYEAEGYDLDGVWYLPDFYLPNLDSFLEVKGVMDPVSEAKIIALAELSRKPVIVVPPFNTAEEIMWNFDADSGPLFCYDFLPNFQFMWEGQSSFEDGTGSHICAPGVWRRSAGFYPSGKIGVCNFPGVYLGSRRIELNVEERKACKANPWFRGQDLTEMFPETGFVPSRVWFAFKGRHVTK